MDWNDQDLQDLEKAAKLLENPGFIARVSGLVGMPIEFVVDKLPSGTRDTITKVVDVSLRSAANAAVMSLGKKRRAGPWVKGHKAAVGVTGAVGGVFGLGALPIELPVTTTLILRSIADIARSEGEDLSDAASKLACLEVFAMGGPTTSDDATESGYFAVRAALARAVSEATKFVAQRSAVEEGAPVIVRLLAQIAARFNTVVGEKIVAQGVPVVGALGGATINLLFIDHFQDMARGHFIVRRLERKHGGDEVRRKYEQIAAGRAS